MNWTLDQWVTIVCSGFVVASFIFFSLAIYPFREWSEETKRRPRSFISNALFREFWYFIMTPLKTKLIQWDVSPNSITTVGLILSLLAGIAFGLEHFGIGAWLVIFAATCDVYDGMLARARKISLKSGAFYDSTVDRVGELGMFFGPLWVFRNDPLWFCVVFIVIASSQVVSYARARAEALGFSGGGGFFQRAERMIVLSIGMSLVPMLQLWVSPAAGSFIVHFAMGFIAVGSFQTAVARSVGIYREIRATEKI